MSDRTRGLLVTLDAAYRVDDMEESVIAAISMIRGVATVEPIVSTIEEQLAIDSAKHDIRQQLRDLLWPPYKSKEGQ